LYFGVLDQLLAQPASVLGRYPKGKFAAEIILHLKNHGIAMDIFIYQVRARCNRRNECDTLRCHPLA